MDMDGLASRIWIVVSACALGLFALGFIAGVAIGYASA